MSNVLLIFCSKNVLIAAVLWKASPTYDGPLDRQTR
jgi:hypothetical protein